MVRSESAAAFCYICLSKTILHLYHVNMKPPNAWIIAAAIVRDGDRILLLEEDRLGSRQLNTPGGRVRSNELPSETAVRELKEETGLDIKVSGLIAVVEGTWSDGANFARFVFEAIKIGGEEKPEKDSRIHWLKLEELLEPSHLTTPILKIESDMLKEYAKAKQRITPYFYQYENEQFRRADTELL